MNEKVDLLQTRQQARETPAAGALNKRPAASVLDGDPDLLAHRPIAHSRRALVAKNVSAGDHSWLETVISFQG